MASVQCLFAAELEMAAGARCAAHTHSCTEIIYYEGARGTLVQAGERLDYADGSVSVYQPHQEHADETEGAGSHLCVGVVGAGADALPPGMWRADEGVRMAAALVLAELRAPAAQRGARLDILAGWLTLEVARLVGAAAAEAALPAPVAAAKAILDTRFHEPLSVRDLADGLFLHPDYLRQLFKQSLGESPLHYLIRRRLDAACELLQHSQASIQTIARQVGLENPYYFSRLFRKHRGVTPSQYRRSHVRASHR